MEGQNSNHLHLTKRRFLDDRRKGSKTQFKEGLVMIRNELKTIGSIELAIKASHVLEKILWITFFAVGVGWLGYFMKGTIEDENPKTSIRLNKKINELDYPAITLCSETTTKYAIAERLGNFLDPTLEPTTKIRNLQKQFLSKFMNRNGENFPHHCKNLRSNFFESCTERFNSDEYSNIKIMQKIALDCGVTHLLCS